MDDFDTSGKQGKMATRKFSSKLMELSMYVLLLHINTCKSIGLTFSCFSGLSAKDKSKLLRDNLLCQSRVEVCIVALKYLVLLMTSVY